MTPTTAMTPTRVPIGKYCWGLGASALALLTGAWLILAPFALGYQSYSASWTSATKNDFWFGIGIVVISAAGLALFTVSLLGALRASGVVQPRPKPQPQPQQTPAQLAAPAAPAAPAASAPLTSDLERTMATLAAALAADLNERRANERQAVDRERTPETPDTVSNMRRDS